MRIAVNCKRRNGPLVPSYVTAVGDCTHANAHLRAARVPHDEVRRCCVMTRRASNLPSDVGNCNGETTFRGDGDAISVLAVLGWGKDAGHE